MSHVVHLMRRFVTSLSPRPPSEADDEWARAQLLDGEDELWRRLSNPDRRHAIEVARRFLSAHPDPARAELAGVLLHDVGKLSSGYGTFGRVWATLAGPRSPRLRRYHDHEEIGAAMASDAGSDAVTVAIIARRPDAPADVVAALAAADDI
jgi:hypothetical protein